MTLNELAKEIRDNAVEPGWYEEPRPFPEIIALCHSELSEALEEYMDGRPAIYYKCDATEIDPCLPDCQYYSEESPCNCRGIKPEGAHPELIDCVIRIFNYCAFTETDIDALIKAKMEYNAGRPYRHGGKRC